MNSFSKPESENKEKKENNPIQKYINQSDFIYFKNELLKDLKSLESKLITKIEQSKEQFDNKFTKCENQINSFKNLILEKEKSLSSIISSNKLYIEKINQLLIFKEKTEEKIFIQENELKNIRHKSDDSIYSLNKFLQDNILYPGIIGKGAKFFSFHNFIDHVLSSISNLNNFKDKVLALDIKNYKVKLDLLMKNYKMDIDKFMDSSKKLSINNILTYDKKTDELFRKFENKLEDEKREYEKKFNIIDEKIIEYNENIKSNKVELINIINNNVSENNKNISNINLKIEKFFIENENINKKINDLDEKNEKSNIVINEKIKSQENKLIIKMSNLYKLMKQFNMELEKKLKSFSFSNDDFRYKNNDMDEMFEKYLNIIKKEEPNISNIPIQIKSDIYIKSYLKKYIDGEIGLNELLNEGKARHNKNIRNYSAKNLNISENNNNKKIVNKSKSNNSSFSNI